MKGIDLKHITLMDKTETIEAENLYNKSKKKLCLFYTIPIVMFVILVILFVIITHKVLIILLILSSVTIIIGFSIYFNKMKKYKELLYIAKLNDKIRHEEKIRHLERNKLQNDERQTTFTTKNIKETYEEYKKTRSNKQT